MITKKSIQKSIEIAFEETHAFKHTSKILMDCFLWATFSEKFEIAAVILPRNQRISLI